MASRLGFSAAIPFRATIGPSWNTAYIRAWEARSVTALYRLPRRGDELPAATGPHMVCDEPTGYRLRAGMAEPWPTGQTLRGPPSVSSPRRAVNNCGPLPGPSRKCYVAVSPKCPASGTVRSAGCGSEQSGHGGYVRWRGQCCPGAVA